jgi:two-component system LytT family response regulator
VTIKVLIVDDEPLARKGVALRLREQADVEIVGMCSNGKQAIQRISELQPDLVFLDIQMPLMGGIEVLRALPENEDQPVIIFLTAYDEHALEAFEVQALDYLLKPIDDMRFSLAVDRARRLIALKQQNEVYSREGGVRFKRFVIRNGKDLTFVETATIDWIEAAGDYVQLHVGEKTYLIRESLNTLERVLDREDFLRIHRSSMIRLDRVARVSALPNRDGFLTLQNGISLRVSRSYSKALKESLRNRKAERATL